MIKTIYEKLKSCTVGIVNKSTENKYSVKGTGFFIGKNKILTCYHVIDNDNLKVIWNDEEYDIKILEEKKDLDLILLKVNTNNDNYVDIDWTVQPRDKCYSFGFPNNEEENEALPKELHSNKDGMTFEVVDENDGKIKFKGEQFKEGFSGSPVLNEETGKVCSIISISRDIDELKGGYGISLEKFSLFNYKDKIETNPPIKIPIIKDDKKLGTITLKTVPVEVDGKVLNVSIYPVTFEEYDLFCEDINHKKVANDYNWGRGRRPIIDVSWYDARNYCKWLKGKSTENYRLLSSVEWNFIASQNISKKNYKKSIVFSKKKTAKVATKKVDLLGLYDFFGNIYEWCENEYCREIKLKGIAYNDSLPNFDKIFNNEMLIPLDTHDYRIGFRIVYSED